VDSNAFRQLCTHADGHRVLSSQNITLAMEAHSGLSAKVAANAGFQAIWASGLSIASQMGLRDCNEASWSQVIDVCRMIMLAVEVPVFVDGDSGFGNFNNARFFAKALDQIGAAGMVLEDKVFPKLNSFVGERQTLADPVEFCGKIRAVKEANIAPTFAVIARTEALVSGHSVEEALDRAHRYADAGADAIFIHSKSRSGADILSFAKYWNHRLPLVVAPTTYYDVPPKTLEEVGVRLYLCANHNLRASLRAMKEVCSEILSSNGISTVERRISPLGDLFDILNYAELAFAEKKYLSAQERGVAE
jgi:phosphoenolpyruvate phosphomutase